jgi:hypothetical protein
MCVLKVETLTTGGELRQLFVVNTLLFRKPAVSPA